jgi:hypothetical protein
VVLLFGSEKLGILVISVEKEPELNEDAQKQVPFL